MTGPLKPLPSNNPSKDPWNNEDKILKYSWCAVIIIILYTVIRLKGGTAGREEEEVGALPYKGAQLSDVCLSTLSGRVSTADQIERIDGHIVAGANGLVVAFLPGTTIYSIVASEPIDYIYFPTKKKFP